MGLSTACLTIGVSPEAFCGYCRFAVDRFRADAVSVGPSYMVLGELTEKKDSELRNVQKKTLQGRSGCSQVVNSGPLGANPSQPKR